MNVLQRKHFDYILALLAYLVMALILMSGILLSPGTIGFFHDWFIGPYDEMNRSWANDGLYKWNSQLGNKIYDTDWIIKLILLPLPSLGGEVLTKGLLILCLTICGFGAFCLARRLKLNWYVSFATGVLYVFTPIIFTRIVAGHLYYLIAYSLSPLVLEGFIKGKEENNYRHFIRAGLLLSFAVVQLQFIIMVFLIMITFAVLDFQRLRKGFIGLMIIFSITLLVVFPPLLLPQMFVSSTEVPFKITQLLSYGALKNASDLAESFRMLGYEVQPYSYLNLGTTRDLFESNAGIIPAWVFYLDYLLPIAGFSVLIFRRDKYTISFAIVSLIGLFLMKGANAPFSGLFTFLYFHGFYIFRELWHIAFLYSFSIIFMIALLLERLAQLKLNNVIKVSSCFALISIIVVSNGYPLLLGNFAGYLQTFEYPSEYHSLYNKIKSEPENNVLILPYVNPVRYDHLRLEGIDPFILDTPTMIFPAFVSYREAPTIPISTWLLSIIQENMTHNLGKVLTGFGIKDVILRKDFVSDFASRTEGLLNYKEKWYTPLEPILDSQTDLKIMSNNSNYKIYENLNKADKIFAPRISGERLSDYDSLLLISNFSSLANLAMYPTFSGANSFIFLDNKREANFSTDDFDNIGRYADSFNARKGWTDNINALGYDHLIASRVSQGLFSEKSNWKTSFELPIKYKSRQIEIWMKALSWEKGGTIGTQIDGTKSSISLYSPIRSFELFRIFEGNSTQNPVVLENIRGKNYVEGFYIKDRNIHNSNSSTHNIILNRIGNQYPPNLVANSGFSLVDNKSRLPSYWIDPGNSCGRFFSCKIDNTEGWNDNKSLQVSTKYPHNIGSWARIFGQEIKVIPGQKYQLGTHMRLNTWATQSNIALEGFNESTNQWYQLQQCPSETDGYQRWKGFSCTVSIPANTTKIIPVLNAGWSSELGKKSNTWFDAISLVKVTNGNEFPDAAGIKKSILSEIAANNSSSTKIAATYPIKEYDMVNPTLWNVHINASKPTTIGFAEPYDERWQAIVYKDGKEVEVAKSMPLYGAINAFQVKHVGDMEVRLFYAPQHWHQIGIVVSGVTVTFCIFFIVYEWRKNKAH